MPGVADHQLGVVQLHVGAVHGVDSVRMVLGVRHLEVGVDDLDAAPVENAERLELEEVLLRRVHRYAVDPGVAAVDVEAAAVAFGRRVGAEGDVLDQSAGHRSNSNDVRRPGNDRLVGLRVLLVPVGCVVPAGDSDRRPQWEAVAAEIVGSAGDLDAREAVELRQAQRLVQARDRGVAR